MHSASIKPMKNVLNICAVATRNLLFQLVEPLQPFLAQFAETVEHIYYIATCRGAQITC